MPDYIITISDEIEAKLQYFFDSNPPIGMMGGDFKSVDGIIQSCASQRIDEFVSRANVMLDREIVEAVKSDEKLNTDVAAKIADIKSIIADTKPVDIIKQEEPVETVNPDEPVETVKP